MARIRTIKPEFFRHEGLQDLEIANPGMYPMMVFEALWGHCDSRGRFEWKPRTLKLDILPFLPFDMAVTLSILEGAGMLHKYTVDGKEYGAIHTFEKHQRLSGKELNEGEKHPAPSENDTESNREATGKQQGSVGEIPESQEGKGREEEGNGVQEGKGEGRASPIASTAGVVCKAIRTAGVSTVNPSHPTLLALLEAGATVDEFQSATTDAVSSGKQSFAYVLGIVKGRREDAARLSLHKGPIPNTSKPINGRQAAISNYAAQAAAARGNYESNATERDITGEAVRVT